MRASIATALEDAIDRLAALELGDAFEPRGAAALVDAGLHRLCVPASAGGLDASLSEAAGGLPPPDSRRFSPLT